MKEQIIETLKNDTKAQSIKEIKERLGIKSFEKLEELEKNLEELTKDGIVHESRQHEFLLMKNTKTLKCGKLHINKSGNGFVEIGNGIPDIFIKEA